MMQDYDAARVVLAGFVGIYCLIGIIWYVLLVIANWKIFTKAGEKGWKSIIPIYRNYILYKISWNEKYFWIKFFPILAAFIMFVIEYIILISVAVYGDINSMDAAMIVIFVIVYLVSLVCTCLGGIADIIQTYNLSKSFNHGFAFTVGLILLEPIFMLILGLGSSNYIGPEGIAKETVAE